MQFLLLQGASLEGPNLYGRGPEVEDGARQIETLLGVTWVELMKRVEPKEGCKGTESLPPTKSLVQIAGFQDNTKSQ